MCVCVCVCDNCLFELHHLIGQWKLIKHRLENGNIEYLFITFFSISAFNLFPCLFLHLNSKWRIRVKKQAREEIMTSTHRTNANKDWIDANEWWQEQKSKQKNKKKKHLKGDLIGFEIELKIDCKRDWRITDDGVSIFNEIYKKLCQEPEISRLNRTYLCLKYVYFITFLLFVSRQPKNCNETFRIAPYLQWSSFFLCYLEFRIS